MTLNIQQCGGKQSAAEVSSVAHGKNHVIRVSLLPLSNRNPHPSDDDDCPGVNETP